MHQRFKYKFKTFQHVTLDETITFRQSLLQWFISTWPQLKNLKVVGKIRVEIFWNAKKIHLAVPLGSLQRSPDSQLYFRGGISAGWVREWEKRGWGLMPSALILNLCNHNRWTVLMNNSIDDDYIATGLERRAAEWLMHQWRQDAGSLVTTSLFIKATPAWAAAAAAAASNQSRTAGQRQRWARQIGDTADVRRSV